MVRSEMWDEMVLLRERREKGEETERRRMISMAQGRL